MANQFKKHYTREEARALLPQVRPWLKGLQQLREKLAKLEPRLTALRQRGEDLGGTTLNESIRLEAQTRDLLREFFDRDIQIKDLDRGLLDFPAIIGGREVFLCWEQGESDIEYWHDIESGYAGREPL